MEGIKRPVEEVKAELARPPRRFSLDYLMKLPSLPDNVFKLPEHVEIPDDAA